MSAASIALNRFGLGACGGEAPLADPRRWLLDQLHSFDAKPASVARAPTSTAAAQQLADYYERQRELVQLYGPRRQEGQPMPGAPAADPAMMTVAMQADAAAAQPAPVRDAFMEARRAAGRAAREAYIASVAARTDAALITPAPFVERLVHFWANHFAVSADKLDTIGLAGSLEFEAIRPHVLGRFADMLGAVERHPAMLLYLDQAVSIGPDSPLGQRVAGRGVRKVGLNENLAREIMELHTLGVRTGYSQADVTEFARAMTGWTVSGIGRGPGARLAGTDGPRGGFVFAPAIHEPGDRLIQGKRYPAGGEAQAQAVLSDLAASPATATHLATKLARHFAGDTPPPAMVARLKAAYLTSGGDLPTVYRAIVASPEAWVETPVKFKTPWEWLVSSFRGLGVKQVQPQQIVGLMNQLGQPVWRPGQPVGYDDQAASWAGPDAVLRRVEAAERFAARAPGVDARELAKQLFLPAITPATAQAIDRAESPVQALALLLVSPDMLRR